jgi:hypothetical protein
MKKSKKVWLGIATIWPVCWMFIFIGLMLTFVFTFQDRAIREGTDNSLMLFFPIAFALHFLTIMGSLGMTIYYIFNIFKNERLDQNYKIMWTILMFFMGMLAQPVYWYLYIWRDAPPAATAYGGGPTYLNQAKAENWTNRAASYQRKPEGEYAPPTEPPNWRE